MSTARRVEAEWLDTLPPADPRAQRSRRELTRVNALMANARIVARSLLATGAVPASIADLGAGDGRFALRLARALGAPPPDAQITLVDQQDVVDGASRAGLEALGWRVEPVQADAMEWLATRGTSRDAMVANLFLHHFEDVRLRRLLALVERRTRRFVACEPRRSTLAAIGARLLGAVGCGEVTRHDAVLSVRAGFAGSELRDNWPRKPDWILHEGPSGLFSHVFRARQT